MGGAKGDDIKAFGPLSRYRCSTPEGTTLPVLGGTLYFGNTSIGFKPRCRHRFHRLQRRQSLPLVLGDLWPLGGGQ